MPRAAEFPPEPIGDEDAAEDEEITELREQVLLLWWEELPRCCRRARRVKIGAQARRRALRVERASGDEIPSASRSCRLVCLHEFGDVELERWDVEHDEAAASFPDVEALFLANVPERLIKPAPGSASVL
jgi:hypothetical protein